MNPTRTFRGVADPDMAVFLSGRLPSLVEPTILHFSTHEIHFQTKENGSMAGEKPIRVAIVGLGFGAEFIPIYQKYPGAEIYAICRRDKKGLDEVGDRYGIKARYTEYRDILKDSDVDAIHINSPIPDHAWMSVEALKPGKHVACTGPMGTSI